MKGLHQSLGVSKTVWFSLLLTFLTLLYVWVTIQKNSTDYPKQSQHTYNEDEADLLINNNHHNIEFGRVFAIYYRASGLFIFGLWCWAINVWFLSRTPVQPQPLLFPSSSSSSTSHSDDANLLPTTHNNTSLPTPSSTSSLVQLVNLASKLTLIYCTNVLLFTLTYNHNHDIKDKKNTIIAKEEISYRFPSTFFPLLLYVSIGGLLFCPYDVVERPYRQRLIQGLKRSLMSPFGRVLFVDVIVLDIFCSFAKVFGDFQVTLCTLWSTGFDLHHYPYYYNMCAHESLLPILITCFPFFWRLGQCLRLYSTTTPSSVLHQLPDNNNNNNNDIHHHLTSSPSLTSSGLASSASAVSGGSTALPNSTSSTIGVSSSSSSSQGVSSATLSSSNSPLLGGNNTNNSSINMAATHLAQQQRRIHLANAVKYGSSLCVILLNSLKKQLFVSWDHSSTIHLLSQLWLVAIVISTLFSLFWDIYYDWNLGQIANTALICDEDDYYSQQQHHSSHHYRRTPLSPQSPRVAPFLLRERLVFGSPPLYYLVLLVNGLLRFAWVIKLLDSGNPVTELMDREVKIFVFEFVEIIRRCLWVFFRLESQYLQNVEHK